MSEQHASIRDGRTRSSRLTRRIGKGRGTRIEDPALKEERDRLFRAKMLLKVNEQKDVEKKSEDAPAGPSIQGRGRSDELQKVLNEKRREEQTRSVQRQQQDRELAEKARIKLTQGEGDLFKDPPEAERFEPEDAGIPEVAVAEKPEPVEKKAEGTVVLPRRHSNRARRSVILKVDGSELVKASGSQRTEAEAAYPNAPKRTRFVFKVLGTLLALFIAIFCCRWVATGRPPSDLASVEGQRELANETEETVSWASQDLKKLLGSNAPETKEDTVKLVEESKEQVLAGEKKSSVAAPANRTVTPVPAPKKPAAPVAVRQPDRTSGPSARYFPEKNPLLNAARDAFQQANVYHAKSDPRVADFDSIQKNIRLAIPLFERCLDECAKARQRGFKGAEVDVLEQAAAMRLYDCRKRETVTP
ncbi:MAG: hypothetical protein HY291_17245 [Planctomycetes bacterium]|nr:hypothetical protein [Planctomycetota bacterium]